jgi:hypothetical protein
MQYCVTTRTHFRTSTGLLLETAFDGGRLTSDGRICWRAQADEELGLCEAMAQYIPEIANR